MNRMHNDPVNFREEMIAGFCAAYPHIVQRVEGASGIRAVNAPQQGKVSVIVGGGSGHYPAFYGLVGSGLASAGVIGDIFTSPSGEQAYRVAKAVDGGAGILWTFGNYSGDVMNFGMAEMRLQAEGIESTTVLVTDDVLSAQKSEADRRRGIAGGFYVFKTAGASAARGDSLREVERLTRKANARTRTAGIALGGCTIPGQGEPLFTVEHGKMEVGLGIHGEPGVRVQEQLSSSGIARLLIDSLMADAPADGGGEVAVLVNGLGGIKYEELFVLNSAIGPLLQKAGLRVYETQIGEFVTSLDMAGCSITLHWLDDELRPLHDATAHSPAYTRIGPDVQAVSQVVGAATGVVSSIGKAVQQFADSVRTTSASDAEQGVPGKAGAAARVAIADALAAVKGIETQLGRLDAVAGDGDHGAGMVRGMTAAEDAVKGFSGTARETFTKAGTAFQDAAGGASGALVGAFMIGLGSALPLIDDQVNAEAYARAVANGLATIQRLGGAQPGDKTMVDTLTPFVNALEKTAGKDNRLAEAWREALPAAEQGMESTKEMVSKRGRSSRLGDRTVGHLDPGATSMYEILMAFGKAFDESK